ncbi:MAG: hypothetical protein JNM70_20415 [Anaerolineae bacterium]|nr:hypothetical protein [Anaerolineae bacterium]
MRIIAHSHSYHSQDSHRVHPSAALHVSLVPPIAFPQLPQLPKLPPFAPICSFDTDDNDDISVFLATINYERQTSATSNPDGTAAIAANSATRSCFLRVAIRSAVEDVSANGRLTPVSTCAFWHRIPIWASTLLYRGRGVGDGANEIRDSLSLVLCHPLESHGLVGYTSLCLSEEGKPQ